MAKLFVAVTPGSNCEKDVQKLYNTFEGNRYQRGVKELPDEKDANYYMIGIPGEEAVQMIYALLMSGYYSEDGWLVMKDPLLQSVYGFYRASVKPDDYTLDQFINEEAG